MRVLGLDVGQKTIGVAISDDMGFCANPVSTLRYCDTTSVLGDISNILTEYNPVKCIIGLPINMNGTIGRQAEQVLLFVDKLKEHIDIPCELWDERLSTKSAEQVLISADISRAKRKKVIDKLAATIILQSYLDSIAMQNKYSS